MHWTHLGVRSQGLPVLSDFMPPLGGLNATGCRLPLQRVAPKSMEHTSLAGCRVGSRCRGTAIALQHPITKVEAPERNWAWRIHPSCRDSL